MSEAWRFALLLSWLAGPAPAGEVVYVPSGWFWQGDGQGQRDERPRRRFFLPAFLIHRHEVTVQAYMACVAAGACAPPARRQTHGTQPVTWVNFHQAQAYCRFVGMRLPTESEWEKAAAGPDGLRFPWGWEPDCRRANFGNFDGQGPCVGINPGRPEPVGRRPWGRSPYGAEEMAGNVWEWTLGRDGRPVLRGGGCCSVFLLPRTANRLLLPADYRDGDIGFRCASSWPHTGSGPPKVRVAILRNEAENKNLDRVQTKK